ncbi:acetoacetyl-CoA synthetase [Trichonephila clavipes]|nr:acetoacetyl-CoA synthetase [Trichonephila clavipes]
MAYLILCSYWDLHRWSIDNCESFWAEIWDYFKVVSSKKYEKVIVKTGPGFLDNKWFVGATLNYAENILRIRDDRIAITCLGCMNVEKQESRKKGHVIFDEAHFWLNGYVNKQNCRIWSEANPQVYVETPLHPEKLTVWCALWAGGIFLQKR